MSAAGGDGAGGTASPSYDAISVSQLVPTQTISVEEQRRLMLLLHYTLRVKRYRTVAIFYSCLTVLALIPSLALFAYIQSPSFANFYLQHSVTIQTTVELLNTAIFYLFLASGFNLRLLFATFRLQQPVGNLLICSSSAALFAVDVLNQVAVHYGDAYMDNDAFLKPRPKSPDPSIPKPDSRFGLSPDSFIPLFALVFGIFCLFSTILNLLHMIYFIIMRRVVRRSARSIPQRVPEGEAENAMMPIVFTV